MPTAQPKEFLHAISDLRGFVICFVVMGHLYGVSGLGVWGELATPRQRIALDLVNGFTSAFVFISGFMLCRLTAKNYHYRRFLTDKLRKLLPPYLFLGALVALVGIVTHSGQPAFFQDFWGLSGGFSQSALFGVMLLNGSMIAAFWYIPFILLMFCVTPVHLWFARQEPRRQVGVLVLSLLVAMLVGRSWLDTNPLHSVIYFTFPYVLGIFCAQWFTALRQHRAGVVGVTGAVVVLCLGVQAVLGQHGNTHKPFWTLGPIDVMVVQKAALTVFLLSVFDRLPLKSKALDYLSRVSFGLFFLHMPVSLLISSCGGYTRRFDLVLNLVINWALTMGLTLMVIAAVQTLSRVLPTRRPLSPWLIGV